MSGDVVWSIGDPAAGPYQFGYTWFRDAAAAEPEYVVGSSGPGDWPLRHPGPLDACTGFREHAATVRFPRPPAAPAYELEVHLAAAQGPCPALDVELNGVRSRWFPRIVREDRSRVLNPSLVAGDAVVRVPLAAELMSDENVLRLVAVADPAADPAELRPGHQGYGPDFGSAFLHEGVLLRAAAAEPLACAVDVAVTPFYVERPDGLNACIDATVTLPAGVVAGTLALDLDGSVVSAPLDPAGRAYGEVRVRLLVPEFAGERTATATVVLDGVESARRTLTLVPHRKWTVHVLPHVHVDLGYTDFQGSVLELHSRNLDRVLDQLARHPDYALSVDAAIVLEQFEATRSPEALKALVEAVRSGRVSVNALYVLFLTGVASLEEVYRSGYLAERWRREHGVPVTYANLTDVPSYSHAMPTLLRALGVDAFVGISNHARAATVDSDEMHLRSPFVWEGPDGARVLTFVADAYAQVRFLFADPPTVAGAEWALHRLLGRFERPDYLPTDFPIVGVHADNEDVGDGEPELVRRWNAAYAYPRLRYSTLAEYVAAVEPLRERLPVVRGDGGSYWEDGIGGAAAAVAAYRGAQVDLARAEALMALTAAADRRLRPAYERLDEGWRDALVGCEHTWTYMHPVGLPHAEQTVDQDDWTVHRIRRAARTGRDETRRALSQLGELASTEGPSIVVANTLGWDRDVAVEAEVFTGTTVVTATGEPVGLELLELVDGMLPRVRFVARDVPAFGYRTYRLVPGASPVAPVTEPVGGDRVTVRTARYELDVAGGRLVSLRHLPTGRELVDSDAPWSLAEVLYVRGGGSEDGRGLGPERSRIADHHWYLPDPDLDVTAVPVSLAEVRRTPVGALLRLRGAADPVTAVEVDVRLADDDDRVDVTVRLDKREVRAKEALYVAFPFAAADPVVRYDRQVGWVDPVRDHLPGACNEWFTTQYAVSVEGGGGAVTWSSPDAPLFTLGDVVRGRWPRAATASGTVLSYVMNNYWYTNFPPAQSGPLTLRYAFRPERVFDPAAAARWGREVRIGAAVDEVSWLDKSSPGPRPLPADRGRLLETDVPEHLAVAVCAARAGGLLLRVQELGGRPASGRVRAPWPVARAYECTATELERAELAVDDDGWVELATGPYGVATVRLAPGA